MEVLLESFFLSPASREHVPLNSGTFNDRVQRTHVQLGGPAKTGKVAFHHLEPTLSEGVGGCLGGLILMHVLEGVCLGEIVIRGVKVRCKNLKRWSNITQHLGSNLEVCLSLNWLKLVLG